MDELRFQSSVEKHEMSALYEDKIQNMGNAGRNGGEYYTLDRSSELSSRWSLPR